MIECAECTNKCNHISYEELNKNNELKHISLYLEEIVDEIKRYQPEYINYILDGNEQEVENGN